MEECKYIFKIIMIGDCAVGKTSIMNRYTDDVFGNNTISTIGLDFKIKTITAKNSKVKLHIWDTAGQERFKAMVSYYYRGADGIFIVFDLTNKTSFIHLTDWMAELDKKDALKNSEIRILGNKVDETDKIQVTKEEIIEFLDKNNINHSYYIEVSAKDNLNIENCFVEISEKLIDKLGVLNNITKTKKLIKEIRRSKTGCC